MKRLIFALLLLAIVIAPSAMAIRDNFQTYSRLNYYSGAGDTIPLGYPTVQFSNQTTGELDIYAVGASGTYIVNSVPTLWTYLAYDTVDTIEDGGSVFGYDTSNVRIFSFSPTGPRNSRIEVKIIGGTPTLFVNGVQQATQPIISVNPSYAVIYSYVYPVDNIVLGELDRHCVGALPSNWTIIRDFINPSANGIYAGYNTTSLVPWVLKSSNKFYLDADTDSTACPGTETFNIANVATGTIVNSTVIDCTVPRHQIAYNLTQFLSPGTSVIPDGEYEAYYTGSTVFDYFWLISQGGWLSFNQKTYNVGDTGTLSWYISPSYINNLEYEYSWQIVDVYGNVKQAGVVATTPTDTSGTVSITFDSAHYSQGAYYGEMVATDRNTQAKFIMGQTAITLTQYLEFYGHVYDGKTALVLSGVKVNFTQLGTSQVQTTTADGNYSVGSLTTGSTVYINVSKTGYTEYDNTFIPTTTGNKSLNPSVYPTSPSATGISRGGIARDQTYGNPIAGATVYVWNTTTYEFHTVLTNAAGGYICDNGASCNLAPYRPYNIQGNATGYSPSQIYVSTGAP